ncbi:MAG: hypothetical protein KA281_02725 [Bacteroidia bacterium]|nr:hypothetical protein [Bacteroidia bacterium]
MFRFGFFIIEGLNFFTWSGKPRALFNLLMKYRTSIFRKRQQPKPRREKHIFIILVYNDAAYPSS